VKSIIADILPLILIIPLGYILKRLRIFKQAEGDFLLKIVFYISLPALIILSFSRSEITVELAWLPFISASIIFISWVIALIAGKKMKLPDKTMGVFIVGSTILNIGFTLPFIIAAFGDEGLTRIMIYDFANGFLVVTFIYYQACRYGGNTGGKKSAIKKLLSAPPLWALLIGLILNLCHVEIPDMPSRFLKITGDLTIPLLMLVIGIYFRPVFKRFPAMVFVILIRMGLGLLLGWGFTELFALQGLTKVIVIVGSATPVGYNTLTFTSMENLDRDFAAGIVSLSMLIGIILTPLLIFLFS